MLYIVLSFRVVLPVLGSTVARSIVIRICNACHLGERINDPLTAIYVPFSQRLTVVGTDHGRVDTAPGQVQLKRVGTSGDMIKKLIFDMMKHEE